ncbi:MAG: nickel pincer cofactor biosynthesis protein LarB, partial [Syntrophomonadaceae bacterium]|nr:nickel pincer cofactor biosynthesis protein LarB [Syntrophomonadaceae bacterium]
RLAAAHGTVLATRAQPEVFATVKALVPDAEYHERARVIAVRREASRCIGQAAVITAGTSDIPVAEEAAVCLETMGARVERIYDVGVAGLHRLFDSLELMERMQVLVVVAGMEGALASVVGGLTSRPVIAVPTSVGYGANFGGLAALLSMLNTCAPGVGVVNIDNGFGAAALAAAILRSVPAGAAPATGEDLQAASEK